MPPRSGQKEITMNINRNVREQGIERDNLGNCLRLLELASSSWHSASQRRDSVGANSTPDIVEVIWSSLRLQNWEADHWANLETEGHRKNIVVCSDGNP